MSEDSTPRIIRHRLSLPTSADGPSIGRRIGRADEASRAARPMRRGIPNRQHGGMTTAMTVLAQSFERRREWLAPTGLIILSLVPDPRRGASRVTQLAARRDRHRGERPVPRLSRSRWWCTSSARVVFLLLGALQFAPSLRRRRWHRIAGRVVVPAGLLSALSALWMTLFYALPAASTGSALFGHADRIRHRRWRPSSSSGSLAIRRGDVAHPQRLDDPRLCDRARRRHAGAHLPAVDARCSARPSQAMHAVLMGAGWVINLAVAEVVIRRSARGAHRGPCVRPADRAARRCAPIMRA